MIWPSHSCWQMTVLSPVRCRRSCRATAGCRHTGTLSQRPGGWRWSARRSAAPPASCGLVRAWSAANPCQSARHRDDRGGHGGEHAGRPPGPAVPSGVGEPPHHLDRKTVRWLVFWPQPQQPGPDQERATGRPVSRPTTIPPRTSATAVIARLDLRLRSALTEMHPGHGIGVILRRHHQIALLRKGAPRPYGYGGQVPPSVENSTKTRVVTARMPWATTTGTGKFRSGGTLRFLASDEPG
jgi:hypothetical protein